MSGSERSTHVTVKREAAQLPLTVVARHPEQRRDQLHGLLVGHRLLTLRQGLRLLRHGGWVLQGVGRGRHGGGRLAGRPEMQAHAFKALLFSAELALTTAVRQGRTWGSA